ncbi:MAG: hypothetical protein GXP55_06150 [Deltaproteobacteria bacterium]|nr:hypothetical protein [Deltaproteobacteria bacterium]
MSRRLLIPILLLAAAFVVPGQTSHAQHENYTLRIATLAPQGSTWMRIFNAWNNSLRQRTDGRLTLQFYPGGSQGDERDFIRKMRAGQMDGAVVTSTGLGQIVRPVMVLAVPGIFREYSQLDRVRHRFQHQFEQQFEAHGYHLLGWGDAGKLRLFSKTEIRRPSDLRSVRPWAWRDDTVFTEFLNVVGANPVRLGVPEVYPALQTGMVDTVPSSALAAVALQWYTRLHYVTAQNMGILIGAAVLKKEKYDALPDDLRTALDETSTQAHRALRRAVRRDDERAYATIQRRGITAVDISANEAEWAQAAATTREHLAGRLYPRSLLERVTAAAGQ